MADFLSREVDSPVSDKTGLAGEFDVHLEWAHEFRNRRVESDGGPSIFTAVQEQLGLKLEASKVTVGTGSG